MDLKVSRDTVAFIKKIYDFDMNSSYINKITDKLFPKIEEFRTRRLDKLYPMIFIDGIRFKTGLKEVSIYVVLGYKIDRMKELLGYWIGESETSKYWMAVFNGLKLKGLEKVWIFWSDNLSGINQAIEAMHLASRIQKCVVHKIRNSMKFVSYKYKKDFVGDMRKYTRLATLKMPKLFLWNLKINDHRNNPMHLNPERKILMN